MHRMKCPILMGRVAVLSVVVWVCPVLAKTGSGPTLVAFRTPIVIDDGWRYAQGAGVTEKTKLLETVPVRPYHLPTKVEA